MVSRPKRRVNAREVLRDITDGMSDADLKRKYNLTDRGLQSLFRKLRQARGPAEGADTVYLRAPSQALGIGAHKSSTGTPSLQSNPKSGKNPSRRSWSCKSCGRKFGRMLKQCPVCGALPTSPDRAESSGNQVRSREPEQLDGHASERSLPIPRTSYRQSNANLETVLGASGALLLLLGACVPIVWFPQLGGLNYFDLGGVAPGISVGGYVVLVVSMISAVLVATGRHLWLWLTGLTSVLQFGFTYLWYRTMPAGAVGSATAVKTSVEAGLGIVAEQPERVGSQMHELVRLDWGWIVLVAGAVLLLSAACVRTRELASHPEGGDAGGQGTRPGRDSCRPERNVTPSLTRRVGKAQRRERV